MRLAQRFGLLIGLATGFSVLSLVVFTGLLFYNLTGSITSAIEEDGQSSLTAVIETMGTVCSTQDELLRVKINNDLNVARDRMVSAGGASLSDQTETWDIVNQFTKAGSTVELPRLSVGDTWLGKISSLEASAPLVDEVKALVGGTCTVFQRVNEAGDMLRVATNVAKLDGTRAIGTYIPATNPDGKPNGVVATLLSGETFRGRAYVVNDWYLTAYEPIKDATGEVVGALYVGDKIESINSIRNAIASSVVGRTGESFVVLGDKFLIAPSWSSDGSDAASVLDDRGESRYQGLLETVRGEGGVQIAKVYDEQGSPRLVAAMHYEPWDWVIFCELPEQDIMGAVASVESAASGLAFWLPVIGVSVVVIAVLIGYLFAARFARPVQQVAATLAEIAEGEGDLTRRLPVVGGPEERALAGAFNNFASTVHDILVEVRGLSATVAGGTAEISSTSKQLVDDMTEQSRLIESTSAAVEELSQSADSVAERTEQAASLATEAGDVAHGSGETLGKTIRNLETIRDSVTAAADAVGLLGQRGAQIGEIIQVINDIADQTNLLALNAAIEAARAGEHGRGFAVVADEVRKLADRTTKATSQITESIEGMQSETDTSVEKINLGSEQANEGAREADQARGSLEKIVESASSVGTLVTDIAAAASEQSQASREISSSVETISRTSVQAREFSETVSNTSGHLAQNAETLSTLVARFKLDERKRSG
ncbi:methyl-accepting chemotaxis protein [Mucisphaera calidilacus]|uniref:Methyl-accepting chemotaxis protein PctB n=1 Tax=Mucisphaera calidilacus TaxID=2527982 RepID=A0A518BTG0_9BACT|nr:methyl-accepting chemotaxis protein [Mucisphaera calidilacus]QDU70260.1 Methyl-accepting chemotaxis protein PctB [Mucisphaera calidilacus]